MWKTIKKSLSHHQHQDHHHDPSRTFHHHLSLEHLLKQNLNILRMLVSLVTSLNAFSLLQSHSLATKVPSLEWCLFKFHYLFHSFQLSAICSALKFNANVASRLTRKTFKERRFFLEKRWGERKISLKLLMKNL